MARPQLQPGQHGQLSKTDRHRDGKRGRKADRNQARWKYMYHYCGWDGKAGRVFGVGETGAKAQAQLDANLQRALDASRPGGADEDAKAKGQVMTVAELATGWLANTQTNERRAERTKTAYRDRTRRYIDPTGHTKTMASMGLWDKSESQRFGRALDWFAKLTVAEANTRAAMAKHLDMLAQAYAQGSLNTAVKTLKGMFGLAEYQGVIDASVMPKVTRGGIESKREAAGKQAGLDPGRALTSVELASLLAQVSVDQRAQRSDMVDLIEYLAGTGVRIAEALALRWEDLNLDHDQPTQHVRGTKTDASDAETPLPRATATLLRERRKQMPDTILVFPTPGKPESDQPRDYHNLRKLRSQVFADASFEGESFAWARFHTFRHTAATMLLAAGVSPIVVRDYLRHKDLATTWGYAGKVEDLTLASSVLDKAIDAALGSATQAPSK